MLTTASDMVEGRQFPKGVLDRLFNRLPINHRLGYNKYKQTEIEFVSLCLLVSVSTDIYRPQRASQPAYTPSLHRADYVRGLGTGSHQLIKNSVDYFYISDIRLHRQVAQLPKFSACTENEGMLTR